MTHDDEDLVKREAGLIRVLPTNQVTMMAIGSAIGTAYFWVPHWPFRSPARP